MLVGSCMAIASQSVLFGRALSRTGKLRVHQVSVQELQECLIDPSSRRRIIHFLISAKRSQGLDRLTGDVRPTSVIRVASGPRATSSDASRIADRRRTFPRSV